MQVKVILGEKVYSARTYHLIVNTNREPIPRSLERLADPELYRIRNPMVLICRCKALHYNNPPSPMWVKRSKKIKHKLTPIFGKKNQKTRSFRKQSKRIKSIQLQSDRLSDIRASLSVLQSELEARREDSAVQYKRGAQESAETARMLEVVERATLAGRSVAAEQQFQPSHPNQPVTYPTSPQHRISGTASYKDVEYEQLISQYDMDRARLRAELSRIRTELESRVRALNAENDRLNTRIDQQRKMHELEMESLRAQMIESKTVLEEVSKEQISVTQNKTKLEHELQGIKKDHAYSESHRREVGGELASLNVRYEALQRRSGAELRRLDGVERALRMYKETASELSVQLDEQRSCNVDLKKEISELQELCQTAAEESKSKTQRIEKLDLRNAVLGEKNNTLVEKNSKLQTEIDEFRENQQTFMDDFGKNVKSLESENVNLKFRIAEMTDKLQKQFKEIARLIDKAEHFQNETQTLSADQDMMLDQYQQLTAKFKQEQKHVAKSKDKVTRLRAKIEKQQKVHDEEIETMKQYVITKLRKYKKLEDKEFLYKHPKSAMAGAGGEDDRYTAGGSMYGQTHLSRGYTYDYILILNVGSNEKEKLQFARLNGLLLKRLANAAIQTLPYLSVQGDEVYVLLGATEMRLHLEAGRTQYLFQLNGRKALELGRHKDMMLACSTLSSEQNARKCKASQWYSLYGIYDPDSTKQDLYPRYNSDGLQRQHSVFRTLDRLRLLNSIIECSTKMGGAGLAMEKDILDGKHPALGYFPLHQNQRKWELDQEWSRFRSLFSQPLNEVRAYFGEKVTLYFAFLGFYISWLYVPAVFGLVFTIWRFVTGKSNAEGAYIYGLFIAIWATLFVEFWKRKECELRVKWGMHVYEEKETSRPLFEGDTIRSNIDGSYTEHYSKWRRLLRVTFSQSIVMTLLTASITAVLGIFAIRTEIEAGLGPQAVAILTTVNIKIFAFFLPYVAVKLNDFENHRTETAYENNLIAKTFVFSFTNFYYSLFYIAFLKQFDPASGGCTGDSCLVELRDQLMVIFISMITINNVIEYIKPVIQGRLKARAESVGLTWTQRQRKTEAEKQYELAEYDSPFEDYEELVVQFGFISLFSSAFPLMPMLALLNNWIEIRLDSQKLTKQSRRPPPTGASNIGTWVIILQMLAFTSAITNLGISIFTSSQLDQFTQGDFTQRLIYFVVIEHAVMLTRFILTWVVGGEPKWVHEHIARQQHITDCLIKDAQFVRERKAAEESLEEGETTEAGFDSDEDVALEIDTVPEEIPEGPHYLI
eukprot:423497_1